MYPGMPTTLLALILLTATISLYPTEPLRLLTELRNRDGRPIGADYDYLTCGVRPPYGDDKMRR